MGEKKAIKLEDLNIIKGYIDEAASGVKMHVDSELKADSENPVQNKVVKDKFDEVEGNVTTVKNTVDTMKNTVDDIPNTYYKKTDTVAKATEATSASNATSASYATYVSGEFDKGKLADRFAALEDEEEINPSEYTNHFAYTSSNVDLNSSDWRTQISANDLYKDKIVIIEKSDTEQEITNSFVSLIKKGNLVTFSLECTRTNSDAGGILIPVKWKPKYSCLVIVLEGDDNGNYNAVPHRLYPGNADQMGLIFISAGCKTVRLNATWLTD